MNYEIKVSYTSLDEATGKEKTFKEPYLVTNADTIDEAQKHRCKLCGCVCFECQRDQCEGKQNS